MYPQYARFIPLEQRKNALYKLCHENCDMPVSYTHLDVYKRQPMHISEMEQKFPEAFVQFKQVCETLEKHYRDMQDMEFTVAVSYTHLDVYKRQRYNRDIIRKVQDYEEKNGEGEN